MLSKNVHILGLCTSQWRRDESRLNWLKFVHDDLTVPSGTETGGPEFLEVLEACLAETKKPEIAIMAARVATLALMWGIDIDEQHVENSILTLLHQYNHRGDHFTMLLSCLIVLLTSSEKPQGKVLDLLLKTDICPTLNAEADKITAKMSGEPEKETETANEEEPALADYLIEFMEAWQAVVASLDDKAVLEGHLKDGAVTFVQLLQHDVDAIRIAAAQCLLSIADLAGRNDVDVSSELADAAKTIGRVAHDRDFDWPASGESRKTFESLGEWLAEGTSGDYLVAVEMLPLSAGPTRGQMHSHNDRRFFEANRNKKGHPIAGFADAAVLEFFNDHLGHNFADLFAIHSAHKNRDNERAFRTMRSVVGRHPAAKNQSLQVDSIRQYGYGTAYRSRSFLAISHDRKGGNRRVRVSDYL